MPADRPGDGIRAFCRASVLAASRRERAVLCYAPLRAIATLRGCRALEVRHGGVCRSSPAEPRAHVHARADVVAMLCRARDDIFVACVLLRFF